MSYTSLFYASRSTKIDGMSPHFHIWLHSFSLEHRQFRGATERSMRSLRLTSCGIYVSAYVSWTGRDRALGESRVRIQSVQESSKPREERFYSLISCRLHLCRHVDDLCDRCLPAA